VGPDLQEILGHRFDALGVADRASAVDIGEGDHAFQDVRQGQEGQDGVLLGKPDDLRDADDVAHEIAVGEDDAFRHPRRPRRINQGGLVLRPDQERFPLEEPGIGRVRPAAQVQDLVEGPDALGRLGEEGDEVLDLVQPFPDGFDLRPLLPVGADDDHGVRIIDDVADLFRNERRVDGNGHGSPRQGREIRHDPFGPVLGNDGQLVAVPQAQRPEPQRQMPDRVAEFPRGQRDVRPVLLGKHEIVLGERFQRIQQKLSQGLDHIGLLLYKWVHSIFAPGTCQGEKRPIIKACGGVGSPGGTVKGRRRLYSRIQSL